MSAMTNTQPGLHVAIIMDGNGRWATQRNLPRVAGHRAGVTTARRIVEHAPDIGIARLTLYAFSSDNWRRPASEVQSIFWLLRAFLRLQSERLRQQGARLEMIGRRDRLPQPVLQAIEKAEHVTAAGRRLHLRVAIDYSSRDAIVQAAADAAVQHKPRTRGSLARDMAYALNTQNANVDLLIRTGGEKRLSDFLLWECAYAELLFIDRMWPDFNEADLDAAIADFHCRQRRFGALPPPATGTAPLRTANHELGTINYNL